MQEQRSNRSLQETAFQQQPPIPQQLTVITAHRHGRVARIRALLQRLQQLPHLLIQQLQMIGIVLAQSLKRLRRQPIGPAFQLAGQNTAGWCELPQLLRVLRPLSWRGDRTLPAPPGWHIKGLMRAGETDPEQPGAINRQRSQFLLGHTG